MDSSVICCCNNVRSKIIKDHLLDPDFYDSMSELLTEILDNQRQKQIDYEVFLKQTSDVAKQVQLSTKADTPAALDTNAKKALYNNLGKNEPLAMLIDETIRTVKQDGFRGNPAKERMVKAALLPLLGSNVAEVVRIIQIIVMQSEYG